MGYTQDNAPTGPPQESPASTPTIYPVPKDGHAVALAVTLSVVGVLLVIGITLFVMRTRRSKLEQQEGDEKKSIISIRQSAIVDLRHPPSHIAPFNTHKPGANMRIARRLDGAWDFEDPEASFYPNVVADPSPLPLSPLSSKSSTTKIKVTEANAERDRRRDTDGSNSFRELDIPPPAYHPEDHSEEGYTNRKDQV
jgi:type II secretory pathway pseudopilin PulG